MAWSNWDQIKVIVKEAGGWKVVIGTLMAMFTFVVLAWAIFAVVIVSVLRLIGVNI